VQVGQRVRLGEGAGSTGRVLELREDGSAVVAAGAVKLVVPVGSLLPVQGARELGARERGQNSAKHPPGSLAPQLPSSLEIDLRGLRADEAEAAALGAVDAAVLADQPHLRIIHGMGTGAVREAVRRVLAADKRVSKFGFAPRNQGGTGVTIAELA
jgi:DNA mismatch repair protein MutS2